VGGPCDARGVLLQRTPDVAEPGLCRATLPGSAHAGLLTMRDRG